MTYIDHLLWFVSVRSEQHSVVVGSYCQIFPAEGDSFDSAVRGGIQLPAVHLGEISLELLDLAVLSSGVDNIVLHGDGVHGALRRRSKLNPEYCE